MDEIRRQQKMNEIRCQLNQDFYKKKSKQVSNKPMTPSKSKSNHPFGKNSNDSDIKYGNDDLDIMGEMLRQATDKNKRQLAILENIPESPIKKPTKQPKF